MRRAVYPGTFDPVTYGHLDVIKRGLKIFDRLVVGVAASPEKAPLFPLEARVELARRLIRGLSRVHALPFRNMAVDFVRQCGARVLLRGIRTFSDFDYEFQMALTNRALAPEVETVFVMTSPEYSYISSRFIKDAARLGAELHSFVPDYVARALREHLLPAAKRKGPSAPGKF